jgi:hypothetical protein
MAELQNVQISLSLFRKISNFFQLCSFSGRTFPGLYEFDSIHSALQEKQDKLNLRTAYTNTIYASNDEQRRLARSTYLRLKEKH